MRITFAFFATLALLMSPIAANAKCKCAGCGDSKFSYPHSNK